MPDQLPSGIPLAGPVTPAPEPVGPAAPQQPIEMPAASDTKAEFEAWKQGYEAEQKRNISRLQSTLMSQQADAQRNWEQEREDYERKLAESVMAGMDEKERGEYQLDMYRQRLDRYEQKLAEEQQLRETYSNMHSYGQWFVDMGVSYSKLDFTNPETLAQSGTLALQEHVRDMQAKISSVPVTTVPAPVARPAPVAASPSPVVTTHGGTPTAATTFEDIRKALSEQTGRQLTDADVFDLAQTSRAVREKLNELVQADAERRALSRG